MRLNFLLLIVVAGMAVICNSQQALGQITYYGYAFEKQFTSSLERAEETEWLRQDANPSISARQAWQLAEQQVDEIKVEEEEWNRNWERQLGGIVLTRLPSRKPNREEWYWYVRYNWLPRIGYAPSPRPYLIIVVSLDGTVGELKCHGDSDYIDAEDIDKEKERPPAQITLRDQTFRPSKKPIVLREADLPCTPSWQDRVANPPLSARRAFELANEAVRHVEADVRELRDDWFRTPALALVRLGDTWLWIVSYEWLPREGGLGGMPPMFDIAVLFDGTVLMPHEPAPNEGIFGDFFDASADRE